MIERDPDAAAVRVPPPLIHAAAIAAGLLLQWSVLPLGPGLTAPARIAGAVVAGVAGLLLTGTALLSFRRTGQDPKPWKTSPEVVTSGPYRWSRNPMYTGMALVQAGLGFGLSNGWLLALVPVVLGCVYVAAVRHEESYLDAKFGESYRAYRRSVRRWL